MAGQRERECFERVEGGGRKSLREEEREREREREGERAGGVL